MATRLSSVQEVRLQESRLRSDRAHANEIVDGAARGQAGLCLEEQVGNRAAAVEVDAEAPFNRGRSTSKSRNQRHVISNNTLGLDRRRRHRHLQRRVKAHNWKLRFLPCDARQSPRPCMRDARW